MVRAPKNGTPVATESVATEPVPEKPVIHEDHLTRNKEACREYYARDEKHRAQAKKRAVMSQIGTRGRICSTTTLHALDIDVHELIIQCRRYMRAHPNAPDRKITDLRILVANML